MSKKRKASKKANNAENKPPQKHGGHEVVASGWAANFNINKVATIGIVLTAILWAHLLMNDMNDQTAILSPYGLYLKAKRTNSFNVTNITSRTLTATTDIPKDTVLMEISRDMMIWDLDAARDDFIQKELFSALKGEDLDMMSKRAILLAAYLALIRNEVIPAMKTQISVVRTLPSYEEYASFHPVLAEMDQIEQYLGKTTSPAILHLMQVRESLHSEYDMLSSASSTFASLVSREDYLASRIAVQSRAFEINNIPNSEIEKSEREDYKKQIGIEFDSCMSMEPVQDWMNSHVNNNVKAGGYDALRQRGLVWSVKEIPKGHELIINYGDTFYDYVLFSQYGFIPADGTGTSVASLNVHHDISLVGGVMSSAKMSTSLPQLEKLMPYLQYDYGYPECITKDTHPKSFELKRLKLRYLQLIAQDRAFWVLPLPPRNSDSTTPTSTTTFSEYNVPPFGLGQDVYEYLNQNALSISLPCRVTSLTDDDLPDAEALLKEDIERLEGATDLEMTVLKLEELEVNINWMARTIHCMKDLASYRMNEHPLTVDDQAQYVLSLVEGGNTNSFEWMAAQMRLEEMFSNIVLESWLMSALESVTDMEDVDELYLRDEPCPKVDII